MSASLASVAAMFGTTSPARIIVNHSRLDAISLQTYFLCNPGGLVKGFKKKIFNSRLQHKTHGMYAILVKHTLSDVIQANLVT